MLKHFNPEQAAKILEIRLGRLRYWDRIGLVKPSLRSGGRVLYDFQDLICLRTAKKIIEKGVAATHLTRSLRSLNQRFPDGRLQLSSLRVFALGDRVIAGRGHRLVDSLSGQYLLDLDWNRVRGEVRERVDSFAATRGADEWYQEGIRYHSDPSTHEHAMHAFRQVVKLNPGHREALAHLGALYYKRRSFGEAERCFERALEIEPGDSSALFHLGLVFEESRKFKKALSCYVQALESEPGLPEAHYQLAGVAETLGDIQEAIHHWEAYLQFDRMSLHGRIAHKRIQLLRAELQGR